MLDPACVQSLKCLSDLLLLKKLQKTFNQKKIIKLRKKIEKAKKSNKISQLKFDMSKKFSPSH